VKKQEFTVTLLFKLTIALVAGTLFVSVGNAQVVLGMDPSTYCKPPQAPTLKINMPAWHLFTTNSFTLSFTLTMSWGDYSVPPIQYYLDGKLQGETPAFEFTPVITPIPTNDISKTFYVTFTGLSEGWHSLEAVAPRISWKSGDWVENQLWPYGYGSPGYDYPDLTAELGLLSSRESFTIILSNADNASMDTAPPTVTTLTTQNTTYDSPEVLLRFTLNEPVSWIGYSLDGKDNVTITEDVNETSFSLGKNHVTFTETTIIKGLTDGIHTLTIYATDIAGNTGTSEPYHFTVATEEQPETVPSLQTILILGAVVTLTIVGIGMLAYFKKRNRAQTLDKAQ